jgi:hypothetical protein
MSRGHDDAGTAHAVLTWAAERRRGQRGIVVPPMSFGAGHELTNRTDRGFRSRSAGLYGTTPRNRRRTGGGNDCSSAGRCPIGAGTSNWNRRGRSREVRDFSRARTAGELTGRCQCGLRRGSIHLRRYDDSGGGDAVRATAPGSSGDLVGSSRERLSTAGARPVGKATKECRSRGLRVVEHRLSPGHRRRKVAHEQRYAQHVDHDMRTAPNGRGERSNR